MILCRSCKLTVKMVSDPIPTLICSALMKGNELDLPKIQHFKQTSIFHFCHIMKCKAKQFATLKHFHFELVKIRYIPGTKCCSAKGECFSIEEESSNIK